MPVDYGDWTSHGVVWTAVLGVHLGVRCVRGVPSVDGDVHIGCSGIQDEAEPKDNRIAYEADKQEGECMKAKRAMKNVYVLVINANQSGAAEDITTVVAPNVDDLIDYVVNEELPEQGYSEEDIEEMGVELDLSENLFWEDPEGVHYIINESKMI